MRKWSRVLLAVLLLGASGAAGAQLALPDLGGVVGRVGATLNDAVRPALGTLRDAATLASDRVSRLQTFVHRNRTSVEFDDADQPARAGEVLLLDPDAASITRAADSGYRLIEQGALDELGVRYARLGTPSGTSLASATRQLRRLLPDKQISADQIHFPGGAVQSAPNNGVASSSPPRGGTVGIIDGGALPGPRIASQAGFAAGAPRANGHGQAIASLLAGAGTARIYVADVYGTDPAGGNALAIAKALGWMAAGRVPVVSISLIGPANPLLERAVAAARARGMIVAAAVGNDGAAAPLAYPASYPGVVAVTGVDGHGRVLIEAGRASHLDYAAPGADMTAMGLDGRPQKLRGTSFAAPLVAARIAALGRAGENPAAALARADAEAVQIRGQAGRGVLCGACRKGI
ncbi:MAG: S8 family serine peptidase [Novosphingobium sp.]